MAGPAMEPQGSALASAGRPGWQRLRRRLLAVVFGLFVVFLLLFVGEVGVRLFCPQVNYQGLDRRLFDTSRPEEGPAWRPNARGISSGVEVVIDDLGYRVIGQAKHPVESWLVLGDSVTFGGGVVGDKTFTGLYQAAHPDIKVFNTAVVGAGCQQYLASARRLLEAQPPVRHLTLFLCLNDIGSQDIKEEQLSLRTRVFHPENRYGAVQQIVEWLRPRSKLYLFTKGMLTDPPTRYLKWDLQKYKQWNPQQPGDLGLIPEIEKLATAGGIPFEVVIFPYEAQLRFNAPEMWLPQDKLAAFFAERDIKFHDARHWFQLDGKPTKDYFLFRDGCHFSALGHALVFKHLEADLNSIAVD